MSGELLANLDLELKQVREQRDATTRLDVETGPHPAASLCGSALPGRQARGWGLGRDRGCGFCRCLVGLTPRRERLSP